MKPLDLRETSHKTAMARGRLILTAEMGWLPGFPLAQGDGYIEWFSLPRGGDTSPTLITLERNHLHRATYTWQKMRYRFPKVLPRLVEDRDRWVAGVPELLNNLNRAIHQGDRLPNTLLYIDGAFSLWIVTQAETLLKHHPELRPVLNALTWITYLSPAELSKSLTWLEQYSDSLTTLLAHLPQQEGLTTILNIWNISRHQKPQDMAGLLRFLGDARIYSLKMDGLGTYINDWVVALRRIGKDKPVPVIPEPTKSEWGPMLLTFVQWLMEQDKVVIRQALALFDVLFPIEILDYYEQWWQTMEGHLKEAQALVYIKHNKYTRKAAKELAKKIENHPNKKPLDFDRQYVLQAIQKIAVLKAPKLTKQICETLALLPWREGKKLIRIRFLSEWLQYAIQSSRRMASYQKQFRQWLKTYLKQSEDIKPFLIMWGHNNKRQHGRIHHLGDDLMHEELPTRLWKPIFATFTRCNEARDELLEQNEARRIIKLVQLTKNVDMSTAYFLELCKHDRQINYIGPDIAQAAHQLSDTAEQFVALIEALQNIDGDLYEVGDALVQVTQYLDEAGWNGAMRTLVLSGEVESLRSIGQRYQALQAFGVPIAIPALLSEGEAPFWIRRYPHAFRTILTRLASLTPDAEDIAGRILDQCFLNPSKVRQEIETIEQLLQEKPEEVKLVRRLANLKARLVVSQPVPQSRMTKLKEKLERATYRTLLRVWQADLDQTLRLKLAEWLAVEDVPAWFTEPRQLRLLAPIFGLNGSFRSLALRLLQKRCGPAPWSLVDDPANQSFIKRMTARGIDMAPWLEPSEPVAMTGKNGKQVWLSFETDPLEIFLMGEHFKTCLSLGSFNFFSVFANAADINKQVVYARDEQGKIQGRCLMAITSIGTILTFEAYAHDRTLGFDQMMGQFAEGLAQQMKTMVVQRGEVPHLVATDWYDDGPQYFSDRLAFLNYDADFRNSLKTLPVDEFLSALQRESGTEDIEPVILESLIHLDEIFQRPELLVPLLPHIEYSEGLPDNTLLRAAQIAHKVGETSFTQKIVRELAVSYLLADHRRHNYLDEDVTYLLIQIDPGAALRVLRQTRPRKIRTDEQEYLPRRNMFIKAYKGLGRMKQAEQLRG